MTSYERVATHHHCSKDVVAGELISVGSARLLTHPINRKTSAYLTVPTAGRGIAIASRDMRLSTHTRSPSRCRAAASPGLQRRPASF